MWGKCIMDCRAWRWPVCRMLAWPSSPPPSSRGRDVVVGRTKATTSHRASTLCCGRSAVARRADAHLKPRASSDGCRVSSVAIAQVRRRYTLALNMCIRSADPTVFALRVWIVANGMVVDALRLEGSDRVFRWMIKKIKGASEAIGYSVKQQSAAARCPTSRGSRYTYDIQHIAAVFLYKERPDPLICCSSCMSCGCTVHRS